MTVSPCSQGKADGEIAFGPAILRVDLKLEDAPPGMPEEESARWNPCCSGSRRHQSNFTTRSLEPRRYGFPPLSVKVALGYIKAPELRSSSPVARSSRGTHRRG